MITKICPTCKKELPLTNEYYYRDKCKSSGFASQCKECMLAHHRAVKEQTKIRSHQYYLENKKRINEANKKYRKDNEGKYKQGVKKYCETHKEQRKNSSIRYREENKEAIRERGKAYYEKNKAIINEKNRIWGKNRRQTKTVSTQRYRAKSKELLSTLTKEQWEAIQKQFDNKCAYCGKEGIMTLDHFIPQEREGEYTHNNIVPACKRCNSSKHSRDFFEWYPKYRCYSKKREKKILKFLGYDNGFQQLEFVEAKLFMPSTI